MAHGGRREGSGRKAWELTPERARVLEAMVIAGMTQDVMAKALGTKAETLRLKARDVLDKAMAIANAKVVESLYQQAVSGRVPAATIFWCKARLGWRETDRTEHTGKEGGPVEHVYRWADPPAEG